MVLIRKHITEDNRDLQEKNIKIIWIDGTFGIGKSAVAAAIVEEIPQAHLLEFDALQEKYKPTSVSDYFGKRYPEAKKYLVDALVDEITEIIQEGSCDCLVIPVALINDYGCKICKYDADHYIGGAFDLYSIQCAGDP